MTEENTRHDEDNQLEEKAQRVLNVIALHIGNFSQNKRSGILTFQIQFNDGEIPSNGYRQIVDETVV